MKTKLIDKLQNNSINDYDIIIICFTKNQWDNFVSNPSNSVYKDIINIEHLLDFDGTSGKYEYIKINKQRYLLYSIEENKDKVYKYSKKNIFIKSLRKSIYKLVKKCIDKKYKRIILNIDLVGVENVKQIIDNLLMVIRLTNYTFDKYLKSKRHKIKHFDFKIESDLEYDIMNDILNKSRVMSKYTNYARNLINERANVCNPDYLEDLCLKISKKHNLKIKIIKGNELLKENMNLFYSVGKGSNYEPRLIILEYIKNGNSKDIDIAFVGKGITFDTGGYNLKPNGSIKEMYIDMAGSAVLLSVLLGMIELNIKKNVVFALSIAENMVDSKSYRPSDILISRKGLSVEVDNTDAEGRLVMADTLTYIQDNYNIISIIDVATLTGGVISGLGESIAGIFGNEEANELIRNLINVGNFKYERCWNLPILDEHIDAIKGKESDLISSGKFNGGQALVATAFLRQFVNDNVKWVHLDIAGPTTLYTIKDWNYGSGTGFGVGLLLQYLLTN